jgi:hypothetical protein
MESLFNYISHLCVEFNIDESHGLKHAKGTVRWAMKILKTLPMLTDEERRMAIYASALHDMCDSKYTDISKSSNEVKYFLLRRGWLYEEADALIRIVTSMSYSKLKKTAEETNGGIAVYPDHGIWQRAYDVARHADLLDAYIVARSYLYNKRIHPNAQEDEHWDRVGRVFDNRIFRYVSDGWIHLPGALELVPELESRARECIKNRSLDWPEPELD